MRVHKGPVTPHLRVVPECSPNKKRKLCLFGECLAPSVSEWFQNGCRMVSEWFQNGFWVYSYHSDIILKSLCFHSQTTRRCAISEWHANQNPCDFRMAANGFRSVSVCYSAASGFRMVSEWFQNGFRMSPNIGRCRTETFGAKVLEFSKLPPWTRGTSLNEKWTVPCPQGHFRATVECCRMARYSLQITQFPLRNYSEIRCDSTIRQCLCNHIILKKRHFKWTHHCFRGKRQGIS